jgi:hypothetical protein
MMTITLAATKALTCVGFGYSLCLQGIDKTIDDTKKIGEKIILPVGKSIYSAGQIMVTDVYSGLSSKVFPDLLPAGEKVISSIYNALPAKETSGNVIKDIGTSGWTAITTAVSDIYNALPAKETSGNVIKDIGTSGWTAITTAVSDIYWAIKTPFQEFTDIDSNNLSAGVGIAAGAVAFSALLGVSAGMPLSIVAGIAGFGVPKGVLGYAEKIYGFNGKTTPQSNIIVNDANNLNKLLTSYPVYSTYKNDVFSMNAKHAEKFTEIKDNLKKEYLDEIEDNVENFDTKVDFCTAEEDDIVNIYSIMHYTHNASKLIDDRKLAAPNKQKDISQQSYGQQFYAKHFDKKQISNDKKQICGLRSEIKYEFINIGQTEYKNFCNSHTDEPLCSDFVKDIIFPDLVEFAV